VVMRTPNVAEASTKVYLESEKLRLEIATLRRAWWQSPTLAATLFASLVTICLSWAAGLFDLRRDQIALETNRARFERDQLKIEIANQERQKSVLEGEQKELARQRESMKIELTRLQRETEKARIAQSVAEQKEKEAGKRLASVESKLRDLGRPGVEITRSVFPGKKADFRLDNHGPGPAILKRFRYFVDRKEIQASSRPGRELLPILDALDIDEEFVFFHQFDPNERLPPGAQVRMFWVKDDGINYAETEAFAEASTRFGIAVCYCSVDDQCGWAIFGLVGKSPGQCK